MRAVLFLLVLALVCVVASASSEAAASRTLLNYGDSLAVGTGQFLPPLLSGWAVRDDAQIGRHADEGPRSLRTYGDGLPRVVAVSLGANDFPGRRDWFRQQVLDVLQIAGPERCVIWSTVARPPQRGVSYEGFNTVLRELDRRSGALRVFDWAVLARAHPAWFGPDGVHSTAAGYRARAAGVARLARGCV